MGSAYFDAMKAHGFSYNTTASVRKEFVCPRCGFQFSLVYARTFACQGCSESVSGCPKVRCAKCDHEFFIQSSPDVHDKIQEHTLADHITRIVDQRNKDMGVASVKR